MAVELGREKSTRGTQDRIGPPQLGVLPLQLPDPGRIRSRGPRRDPLSIWACFAQPRNVSALIPSSSPTRRHAPDTDPADSAMSSTSRTARSRTSSGYFLGAAMTPTIRWLGASIKPGAIRFAGYPLLHLVALAETGTRGLLGAVLGAAADGDEPALAAGLLHLLGAGMLVLLDRAYDAGTFLQAVAGTGAGFLARGKASRCPAVLRVLPDGSYLSRIGELDVRIIEASVQVAGAGGSSLREAYRLITTLTDHHRYPAADLVRLYHERWEIESAYYALRHTLLQGRVLRSGDRPGLEQETWALLTGYQLLRMVMTDAIATRPGTDPDRASFTTALHTATTTITAAAGISPAAPAALPATSRAVLATLLPPRRPRYSARKIKSPRSRYPGRDNPRPALPETITTITITIHTPPPATHRPRPRPRNRQKPRPGSHRHHVTALMTTNPGRTWTGHELAARLHLPPATMLSHLAHWAQAGFLTRTAPGTYALPNPP